MLAVGYFAVASAKLDADRSIGVYFCGDDVQRVGIVGNFLEVSLVVVEADGPEAIDGTSLLTWSL
jgi:hypothetical protein